MAETREPVNRFLSALAGSIIITSGLYLGMMGRSLLSLQERPLGFRTIISLVIIMGLAMLGALISKACDRIGRPRGPMLLGLSLLLISRVMNLWARPELTAFMVNMKSLLPWASAIMLLVVVYIWSGRRRGGLIQSLGLMAALMGMAMAWLVFPFKLIFSDDSIQHILTALFVASLLGTAIRIRRRIMRPVTYDLAAASLIAVTVLAGNWGARQYLRAHGFTPPRSENIVWGKLARPPVILVVWDTVRRDHLSVYGYGRRTTPFLEQFAAKSTVYPHAYTVAPYTLPSHASMFTGLYPRSHGANDIFSPETGQKQRNYNPLDLSATTLAELLSQKGYQSGAVSANYTFVSRQVNMDQGFEYFYNAPNLQSFRAPLFRLQLWLMKVCDPLVPTSMFYKYYSNTMNAREVTDRALAWLDSLDHERPPFLFLNFMDAHQNTYPPEDLRHLFPGFRRELAHVGLAEISYQIADNLRPPLTASERDHFVSQYDAQLVNLDRELKRFTHELATRGLLDQSLFIVTSDHGEFFGEHGLLEHGRDVYNEVLAIPLIIHRPEPSKAGVEAKVIENRQLFYVILKEAGIESPAAKNTPWEAVGEFYPVYLSLKSGNLLPSCTRLRRSVIFGGFKFIQSSDGKNELYNLVQDPREMSNLLTANPKRAQQGQELMKEFLSRIPEYHPASDGEQLDPEQLRNLKAMGYIQ